MNVKYLFKRILNNNQLYYESNTLTRFGGETIYLTKWLYVYKIKKITHPTIKITAFNVFDKSHVSKVKHHIYGI